MATSQLYKYFNDLSLLKDQLNIVILYDSTGRMDRTFPTIKKVAKAIISIGTLFKNVSFSLISFKDYDVFDNGYQAMYDVKSVDDVETFLNCDLAYGGGFNVGEASMSALLRAMTTVPNGNGYLFYLITDDDIRFTHDHKFYPNKKSLTMEIENNIDKVNKKFYVLDSLFPRLLEMNAKLTIFSTKDRSCYQIMERKAKYYEVFRPLVEVFIVEEEHFNEITTVIGEDIAINLSNVDTSSTTTLFGTKLRTATRMTDHIKRMILSEAYGDMSRASIQNRTTTTKNVKALINGALLDKFLHFPIFHKPLKTTIDIYNMIYIIKQKNLLPYLVEVPSLGLHVRNLVDFYGTPEHKKWLSNIIGSSTDKQVLVKQKLDLLKMKSNDYIKLIEDNIHSTDGYFTLDREVKDWSKDITPTAFLGMLEDSVFQWMLNDFLPYIRYLPNNEDEPVTSIYTRSGKLRYLPATYKEEVKFMALQVLPMLVTSSTFTNAESLSLLTVSALIVKCENLSCLELMNLAIDHLKTTSAKLDVANPKLHSSNLQRLLMHDSVRPHLHPSFLNRVLKSFQINSFLILAKNNESFPLKNELLSLTEMTNKQMCIICYKLKDVKHVIPDMYICRYCAIITNNYKNPIAFNMHRVFEMKRTSPVSTEHPNTTKGDSVRALLEKKEVDYTNKDVILTCSRCREQYYVWRICNVPANKKHHKCPKCRLTDNVSDKTIMLFEEYLKQQNKFNPLHHLINLEFIKYNVYDFKCPCTISEIRDSFNNIINDVHKLINEIPMSPQPSKDTEVVYEWHNKPLQDLISRPLMQELLIEQLHQDLDISNFWNVKHPLYPTTYDVITEDERVYKPEEVSEILNGVFITTKKGKFLTRDLPENILTLTICNICYNIDNPTLIWHCSFPVCKRCNEQLKSCPVCKESSENGIFQKRKINETPDEDYDSMSDQSINYDSDDTFYSDRSCVCCN